MVILTGVAGVAASNIVHMMKNLHFSFAAMGFTL